MIINEMQIWLLMRCTYDY